MDKESDNKRNKRSKDKVNWRVVGLALFVLSALMFNYFFDVRLKHRAMVAGLAIGDRQLSEEEQRAALTFLRFREIKKSTVPFGIPEVYGKELDVNFDEVQESMDKMQVMGPTYGEEGKKIILEGEQLQRFVDIGEMTACEYCCGVAALVKDDGSAACGCAHSIVMRGLAAYLIKNHSDELADEEILAEINNWKKTFFPKQTLAAAFDKLKQAGDEDIDVLLQEFPDFLPQMVGGC